MILVGKRIALVPVEEVKMTAGGIMLPDVVDNQKDEGIVTCVGKDCETVKVGDKVKFAQYGASVIEVEGQTTLIITEEDVLAILNRSEELK